MNILVACEESQRVCTAFREKGHKAFSCDIIECSGGHPEWHIKGDVLPLLNGNCEFKTMDGQTHAIEGKWDMIMANEKRLIDAYLNGEVPKIKTHFAEIIVRGQTEKPYYNIIFIDPQTREYEVCFGSYSLENVRKWLSEEFEIVEAPTVDAVEVVHGRWEDNHCTACGMMPMGEELWEHLDCDPPRMEYFMDYCPNCGAKMDGDGNG